ncbi:MAG: hypothetical protein AAGA58_07935 [Verrucomicrobiota bacterium]
MARKSRKKAAKAKKKSRWLSILSWSALGLLVLVAVIGFGAVIAIRGYLKSEKFRDMLSAKASGLLKAETEFSDFSWNGTSVVTDKVTAFGYEDAVFAKLKCEGVSASIDLDEARRGTWRIPDVSINRVNVLFDKDDRIARPDYPTFSEDGSGGGLFAKFIPKKVAVDRAVIEELRFDIKTADDSLIRGREWAAELTPSSTEGIWKMQGQSGKLELEGIEMLPLLNLDDVSLRIGKDRLFVDDASFTAFERGKISVTGEVSLEPEGDIDLVARFRDMSVSDIVPEDWVKKLKGTASGRLEIAGSPSDENGFEQNGTIEVTDGLLEALPVLDRLEELTNTKKFRRLHLSQLNTTFVRKVDQLELEDFIIDSSGVICLKGHVQWEEQNVAGGKYMLGLAPDVIKWMPSWKKIIVEEMFSRELNSAFSETFSGKVSTDIEKPPAGYRWTVVTVDPTAAEPFTADLRRQLIDAGGLAILAEIEGLSEEAIEKAKVVAEAAVESGTDLAEVMAENGFDSVESLLSEEGLSRLGGLLEESGLLELPKGLLNEGMRTLDGLNPFR